MNDTVKGDNRIVYLSDSVQKYILGTSVSYLLDKSQHLTIDQIRSTAYQHKFQYSTAKYINISEMSTTQGAVWVRFRLQQNKESNTTWILDATSSVMESVTLYSPKQDGSWQQESSGSWYPIAKRPIKMTRIAFPISIVMDSTKPYQEYFLRVICDGEVQCDLELYQSSAFYEKEWWDRIFYGIVYGMAIFAALYNFVLWLILRDKAYLWYVLYVVAIGSLNASYDGVLGQILWIDGISQFNMRLIAIVQLLAVFCAAMFSRTFLMWHKRLPRFNRFIGIWLICCWMCIIASAFHWVPLNGINDMFAFTGVIFFIGGGVAVVRQGFAPARLYTIAWGIYTSAVMYTVLSTNLNIPHYDAYWTFRIPFIASTIEMTLFSIALSIRITLLQNAVILERQHERERIFRDIHDGLGAQIVEIAAMSEQLKSEVATGLADNATNGLQTSWATSISASVQDLRTSLREIVWLLNMENDTLDALVAYLRQETRRVLELSQIQVAFDIADTSPSIAVDPDVRRNIVMAVREACGNIIKHAAASGVRVESRYTAQMLVIAIHDNGRGFDKAEMKRFSNGLKTMEKRMTACGGTAEVESVPGGGTVVRFSVPLG